MKPLIVLLVIFSISSLIIKGVTKSYDYALAGRIALSVMLIFTAIGHFVYTQGMSMMIPKFIPLKIELIYLTGIFEILMAIGLLTNHYKVITGWVLIVFLILMLPANIYAAINKVDYQNATFEGNGLVYLWFRVPLQFLFICWAYFSAIR